MMNRLASPRTPNNSRMSLSYSAFASASYTYIRVDRETSMMGSQLCQHLLGGGQLRELREDPVHAVGVRIVVKVADGVGDDHNVVVALISRPGGGLHGLAGGQAGQENLARPARLQQGVH